jgi:hypothetical protein
MVYDDDEDDDEQGIPDITLPIFAIVGGIG